MNRSLYKIFAAISGTVLLLSCGDDKPAAPNPAGMPVPVNFYVLTASKATFFDLYPATVTAMMQVDIHPEVEGYVTGIFFKEGSHVEKGQKLYTIDDSKYMASNNQAKANLRVAESNLDQAQKDADRYTFLDKHDAVAKQVLDHAMTTLQNAKDQVAAAKQDLIKTGTDLNYAVIKAPFSGTIGISQVKLGNTVTIGQTILNTISTDDPMAVDFDISEKQIPRFLKLQQQKPSNADSIFTVLMPDNSLYPQEGQIYVMDRGVNPQTGTMTVRLSFPNPNFNLRAGMSCKVRVKNTDTAAQLIIPAKSIVEQMGEYFVFIAKDTLIAPPATDNKQGEQQKKPGMEAIQKKVLLGQTIADSVIVRSGLQAGDRVLVDGIQKLHNGSLIAVGQKPAH